MKIVALRFPHCVRMRKMRSEDHWSCNMFANSACELHAKPLQGRCTSCCLQNWRLRSTLDPPALSDAEVRPHEAIHLHGVHALAQPLELRAIVRVLLAARCVYVAIRQQAPLELALRIKECCPC